MTEQTDRQLLQETHDAVIELKAVVLGVNGRGGLIQDMAQIHLSVDEMVLKRGRESYDVVHLLEAVPKIEKRIDDIDTELHEPVKGVCDRVSLTESGIKSSERTIKWIISGITAVALAILGLVLSHVF